MLSSNRTRLSLLMAIPASKQNHREGVAGKLRTLVGVGQVGLTRDAQGVLQAVHAKTRIQGIGKPP